MPSKYAAPRASPFAPPRAAAAPRGAASMHHAARPVSCQVDSSRGVAIVKSRHELDTEVGVSVPFAFGGTNRRCRLGRAGARFRRQPSVASVISAGRLLDDGPAFGARRKKAAAQRSASKEEPIQIGVVGRDRLQLGRDSTTQKGGQAKTR